MDEYPTDFITIGTVENVFTTHVTHQEQFYIHIDTRSSILEAIMEALETRYEQLSVNDKPLSQLKLGGLCAAKFTDDNNWYRAKITGLPNNGLIEVNFVDYGNTDYVSADRVKSLDPDLKQYPVQSYRCALAGVSCKHGVWPPEMRVQFEDLVIDKGCKAVFCGKTGEDVYLLDMYDEQGNYINKMFGALDKKESTTNMKVNGNGSDMMQRFQTVSWRESQKFQAVVVFVTNPDMFWCQEVQHTNDIIILSEELSRLHMTQGMGRLKDVRPGSICAAKFHEDEAWYRGIIQSISRNQAQVYFVDYGNTESVEFDSLCELKPEFMRLPALAVKCSLVSANSADGTKWSQEAVEEFEKLVVDREFEVNVIGRQQDGYKVSLLDVEENKDVGGQLKQILGQRGVKAKTPPKPLSTNNNKPQSPGHVLDLPVGSSAHVFVSWIDNPADFWVQVEQSSDILENLTQELQDYYAQDRPLALSSPGAFVIARFTEDQQWYRGLVLKDLNDQVKVLFIDYGNADTILKSELRQVNPQFGQIDPLAFRCSLKGVRPLPQDNTWSVDAKDFLDKITVNGCQCKVLDRNDAYRFVALSVNGKDVAQELVSLAVVAGNQAPQAKPSIPCYQDNLRLRENQPEQVMVTHIDSPNSFWVQLSKNSTDLDAVMEKLENHYSENGGTPVVKPTIGQACVAQYSLDNAWYRACISNVSSSGYDIHFVDYGNREVVPIDQVCVVEPRFLDLQPQAIKCSLSLPGNVAHLTDMLSDIVLEKDVILKVLAVKGDLLTVDLISEGQSVCHLLKSQSGNSDQTTHSSATIPPAKPIPQGATVKAYTSVVHSPGRFFLQIAGIDDELSALMDQLALQYIPQDVPAVSQPAVGMYCVALYEEDKQWYRGRITSVQGNQSRVLFVDYGNEELISNSFVKSLTGEVSQVPILSYECTLHGVRSNSWSESSIAFFESLVMDQELSCTFVSKSDVTIVADGQDVAEKIISAGHGQTAGGVGPKSPLSVTMGQSGFGNKSPKSPGFGASPRKDDSRGFGSNRQEDRGFGGSKQEDKGFGGGRCNFEEEKGFGSGRRDFGEDKSSFGGGRREKRGFDGGDSSKSFIKSDESFKPRSRDGDSGGFGRRGGDGDDRGFGGGGKRDRNISAGSSNSNTADKFSYADPPSEPESAIMVHIDDDGTFYIQLPSMEKDILFLSKRLAGSYKSGGPRLKDVPSKGVTCCCKFPDDGSMYRCQIEAVDGNKVMVRYMDYGNVAEHSTYDLKFLFPDLLQYTAQAFPCKLRGMEWSLDKAEKFGAATLDKDLEVTFTSTSVPYEVDIKTPDGDLLAIMTGKVALPAPKISPTHKTSPNQAGFGGKSPKGFGGRGGMETSTPKKFDNTAKRSLNLSSSPVKPSVPKQAFIPQTAPSESQTSFISHISENGYFYLQFEKDTALLDSLTEKLSAFNSTIHHPNLSKGAACAAVFSEDSLWYRAVISEVHGDQFTVTFVDFGNGDKVSKESIRPLTEDLLSPAPLAYQCLFDGDKGVLSETSKTKLDEYFMEHQLTVSFVSQSTPFVVTATTSDGQDLHEIVCPSNRFRSPSIPKEVTPVGVCHIEDDGRFFTYFFKQLKSKNALQKRLQSHCSSSVESLENPEVGMPCCVKSSLDDLWHRCQVKNISDFKIEVQCVDIGNIDSVEISDLKILSSEYLKDAPFALECRLKGVESWTDNLKEKFVDMTKDKILNSTFYTTSPPFRVSLARSIELDLLGLNAPEPDSPRKRLDDSVVSNANMNRSAVFQGGDSYITEVTTQGIFFVQLVSEEEQLQSLCASLETIIASTQDEPDSVELENYLCAKFTEDDVWYRAIVEEKLENDKFTVRFVDYGNTDSLGKDRLLSLPDELSSVSIPAFAYKCKLTGQMSEVEEFRTAVLDNMVSIEVVSAGEDGVFQVNVKIDGQDVIRNKDSIAVEGKIEGNQEDVKVSEIGKRTTVIIPYVINPSQFYIQLKVDQDKLETMMDELYEELNNLSEGEGLVRDNLVVGDLYAALYEDSWYRTRVVSVGDDCSVQVLYVDHGNTETVSAKSELRVLPDKFKSLPLFGHEASLPGIKPVNESWSEDAIETYRDMVEEKSFIADLIDTSDDKPWVVQLLDMGTPIQDALIAKGHGVATEIVAVSKSKQVFNESVVEATNEITGENTRKSKKIIGNISDTLEELKPMTAFVSHCDSPSQIWCQLASSTDDLEELADKLETAYNSPLDSDKIDGGISNDDFVIGLFEDDGMRYRSVVINAQMAKDSEDDGKVLLRFIDYGNCGSCSKEQILNVREELYQQPGLSCCCCLDKIQPLDGVWSPEVCTRLTELTADQELLMTLVGRKQDGTALVDLVLQESGKSLSNVMIEEGLVKSLEMDTDTSLPVKIEIGKGDVSECLEISQPIMESTAMVEEASNSFCNNYSVAYAIDGYYKCIELSLYSTFNVVVSDDELPNAFCVNLKELTGQLDTLMKEIAEQVASDDNNDYLPKIGDPCLVEYDSLWYRGLIKMSVDHGEFVVMSVDYGWEVSSKPDKLQSIPKHFLELPAQAIRCYLAGIVSLDAEWSAEAITFFTEYLSDHKLQISIVESADDGKYGVSMMEVEESDSASAEFPRSLNRMFVDMEYAEIVPGSNIDTQFEMEKTLDTDMLNELEESFKEREEEMENDLTEGTNGGASTVSQADTFASAVEEEQIMCKDPPEVNTKYYQLVHLTKSETEGQSLNDKDTTTEQIILNKKDIMFNIASAVDRIDQMGCIDLFPEDSLPYLTSDVDSLLEVSKENKSLVTDTEKDRMGANDPMTETRSAQSSDADKTPNSSGQSPLYTWSQQSSLENVTRTANDEIGNDQENSPIPNKDNYEKEGNVSKSNEGQQSNKKAKSDLDSEQSSPPSFHSIEDEEEENSDHETKLTEENTTEMQEIAENNDESEEEDNKEEEEQAEEEQAEEEGQGGNEVESSSEEDNEEKQVEGEQCTDEDESLGDEDNKMEQAKKEDSDEDESPGDEDNKMEQAKKEEQDSDEDESPGDEDNKMEQAKKEEDSDEDESPGDEDNKMEQAKKEEQDSDENESPGDEDNKMEKAKKEQDSDEDESPGDEDNEEQQAEDFDESPSVEVNNASKNNDDKDDHDEAKGDKIEESVNVKDDVDNAEISAENENNDKLQEEQKTM